MDPVRGSGANPVNISVSGQPAVETSGEERPDTLAGPSGSGVYGSPGTKAAARGDWPPLPDPGGSDFGVSTVDRCGAEIAKLEAELDKLGTGPEDMAKAMKLQRKLDTLTRIMTLISEIWKSRSDAIRSVINNIN